MNSPQADRSIGVVVVTFNSADVIAECLESLMHQRGAEPTVIVVDNASTDNTLEVVRNWAGDRGLLQELRADELSPGAILRRVVVVHSGANRGFAGGVNLGLKAAALVPEIRHFWVLNPDAFADEAASESILAAARTTPGYGLIGGRVDERVLVVVEESKVAVEPHIDARRLHHSGLARREADAARLEFGVDVAI